MRNKLLTPGVSSAFLIFVPISFYFFLIIHYAVNIPLQDDYDTILAFLNLSDSEKFRNLFVLHNEHRLAFNRITAFVFSKLFGEINFIYLCVFGNLSLLPLFFIIAKNHKLSSRNIFLAISIAFLLFQPQYWSNMTWATAALQNNFVIFFGFTSIYFWTRENWINKLYSVLFALAATFTSGNGLFIWFVLIIIELTIFINKKNQSMVKLNNGRIVVLLLFTTLVLFLYFKGYTRQPNHPGILESIYNPVRTFKYFCAFLGAYLPVLLDKTIILGIIEIFIFIYITLKKYYNQNPVIYFFLLYLLFGIIAASLTRSPWGWPQAISSRYRIISILILICELISISELYVKYFRIKKLQYLILLFSIMFHFGSLKTSSDELIERKNELIQSAIQWNTKGEGLLYPRQTRASNILKKASEKGIYQMSFISGE